ncbi:aminoacyl-tRNA hydrolase [Desulfovibrio litoralis]|uniref:Peptidyl-tRNA hydrolase n=1 Tax=Desulfovibrio litoralis DSM 11393 TaxID=1121455 RepID=A0A1M7SD19_9BACT|nr:aminoacyl-tRNA hydrolase [Desulfovibrio litoralis]SHN56102.1 peptidyl-tRNA hydrolase [Desulfovibrio litoralis DSM 11393]
MYSGLIVGLGNPGSEYNNTRHNFGFMLIDGIIRYAEEKGAAITRLSSKGKYELWKCQIQNQTWLLQKPLTFMNLSGEAVIPVLAYYKLKPEQLIVAHDELDLPLGRIKFQLGGGAAGHNGIKSILQCIGGVDFWRLRLGIGKNQVGSSAGYVLNNFYSEEKQSVEECLTNICDKFWKYFNKGFIELQKELNTKKP